MDNTHHHQQHTTNKKKTTVTTTASLLVMFGLFLGVAHYGVPTLLPLTYQIDSGGQDVGNQGAFVKETKEDVVAQFVPLRLPTPDSVRAIYMTQCVAGTPSFRRDLIELAEETEINSIVIDIKDFSGGLGFVPQDPELKKYVSQNCFAPDMQELVYEMNQKGIYVIGRITVFQDPLFALDRPDLAVQKASDKTIWEDYKGLHFIDAGAVEAWDRVIAISKEAYAIGFDELNYDYIRFPSDGNMQDIYYPFSEDRIVANPNEGKAEVIEEFFAYLQEGLKETGVKTSADLFGMVTTNADDLNIGQQLERALPYFDYVAPMVYPSHFPKGFNGYTNPNDRVYDVIAFSMGRGVARLLASTTRVATLVSNTPVSTTTPSVYPKDKYSPDKLRPWLQDFDYGGNYDIAEVRAQMQAAYDVGLDSWMLWDPANRYTRGALLPEGATSSPLFNNLDLRSQ